MRIFMVLIFLVFSIKSNSQSLEGKWKGSYNYNTLNAADFPLRNEPIELQITKNSDSSYNILSYSSFKKADGYSSKTVCKVKYKKKGKHGIQLEEYDCTNSEFPNNEGLQLMFLKIIEKKGVLMLQGRWEATTNGNKLSGDINFSKLSPTK